MILFMISLFSAQAQNQPAERVIQFDRPGVHTDAVLVYKNGQKIFDYSAREYEGGNKKHLSWSMAKTFAGIMIGQAANEGKLSLSDKVSKYIPAVKTDATILDVLRMSSGIAFKEEYSGVPVDSDATKMLYLQGLNVGFGNYVASLPARDHVRAGEYFDYSSGDTNLLMEVLRKVSSSKAEYDQYPFEKIFKPLGISDATFEQDATGTFVGSSYVYLKPSDYLKIGQLLMQKGVWNGVQVIPESYYELMNTPAPGVAQSVQKGVTQTRVYSSQITTNQGIESAGIISQYADIPVDALIMIGHQGQLVVASPSEQLIIVRLAMDKGTSLDRKGFFGAIKELVKEKFPEYKTAREVADPTPAVAPKEQKGKTNYSDYLKVPHLIRALAAKEYCSCRNVVGRSEAACKADLKVSLPILPHLTLEKNGDVKAYFGPLAIGPVSKAKFISQSLGCTLVQSE